jgi:hypothetical protein
MTRRREGDEEDVAEERRGVGMVAAGGLYRRSLLVDRRAWGNTDTKHGRCGGEGGTGGMGLVRRRSVNGKPEIPGWACGFSHGPGLGPGSSSGVGRIVEEVKTASVFLLKIVNLVNLAIV